MMMTRKQFEEIMIDAAIRMNLDLVGIDRFSCNHNEIFQEDLDKYPDYHFGKNGEWIRCKSDIGINTTSLVLSNLYLKLNISLIDTNKPEMLSRWLSDALLMFLANDCYGWHDDLHISYLIHQFPIKYLHRADADESYSVNNSMRKLPDEDQLRLIPVAGLSDYYRVLPKKEVVTINLSRNEMAAILQAYDYGTGTCDDEGKQYLNRAIGKIKNLIHPQGRLS